MNGSDLTEKINGNRILIKSERRAVVLDLLMEGHGPKVIAQLTNLNERTIKNDLSELARLRNIPAFGKFHTYVRLAYLVAIERNLLRPNLY